MGRPRATTRQQDRHLRIGALRDKATTASTLRGRLRTTTGVNVSCNLVRRRLREAGLRSRRPALGQGAILQDDNAPAHRARLVTNFLGQQNVNDDVACLLARPQPDRASVGCLGTAAQVQPLPACYPGQADPDPTGGVECHTPDNPSEPCVVDASSIRFDTITVDAVADADAAISAVRLPFCLFLSAERE